MHNRIKEIRTKLGLSQAAFGERIGLKQKAIGLIEQGINKLTERNFEAICREFKINPDWLRTGEGEMLDTSVKSTLDELCAEYNLGDDERLVLQLYLEFPPEYRVVIAKYIKQTLALAKEINAIDAEEERQKLKQKIDDAYKTIAESQEKLATLDGGGTIAKESSDVAG